MEEHKIIIVLPWATPFGIHTPSVENLQILVNKIEECKFQVDKLILQFYIKSLLPLR